MCGKRKGSDPKPDSRQFIINDKISRYCIRPTTNTTTPTTNTTTTNTTATAATTTAAAASPSKGTVIIVSLRPADRRAPLITLHT
ncbi:hypothetical protein E2C01_097943 [Portunus trituberculatus]|uniref:Uncharacterized protein n=1 Tax=Portunus trituberculatus TaxID=210409 RepID=A0A5B7KCP7_PORTR|nr:hypothetical protein [Portunus trituberculatus]